MVEIWYHSFGSQNKWLSHVLSLLPMLCLLGSFSHCCITRSRFTQQSRAHITVGFRRAFALFLSLWARSADLPRGGGEVSLKVVDWIFARDDVIWYLYSSCRTGDLGLLRLRGLRLLGFLLALLQLGDLLCANGLRLHLVILGLPLCRLLVLLERDR